METRLFRTLVVFGASLTGGIAINACTGGPDTTAAADASADGDYGKISPYGRISAECAEPPCYGKISPPSCPNGGQPPTCNQDEDAATDSGDASDASDASDAG